MNWGILHMFYIGALDTIYIYLREIYFNGTGRYHFFILLFFYLLCLPFENFIQYHITCMGDMDSRTRQKSRCALFFLSRFTCVIYCICIRQSFVYGSFFFHVN